MTVRTITVRERVLARNDEIAAGVRSRLASAGVRAVNLVSSPGAGKTLLLERTLADLAQQDLTLDRLCDLLLRRMLPDRREDDVALVAVRLHAE